MARSQRFILRNQQGRNRNNRNWDAISEESGVRGTAAQWEFFGGVVGTDGRPFLGEPGQEPNVYMTNTGPHGKPGGEAAGVEFLLHAESNCLIDIMITITVFDPVESFDVVG